MLPLHTHALFAGRTPQHTRVRYARRRPNVAKRSRRQHATPQQRAETVTFVACSSGCRSDSVAAQQRLLWVNAAECANGSTRCARAQRPGRRRRRKCCCLVKASICAICCRRVCINAHATPVQNAQKPRLCELRQEARQMSA